VELSLEFVDSRHVVQFADGTYRWIDVKRFRQDRPVPGLEHRLLPVLLEQPNMRDLYFGVGHGDEPSTEPVHGPYWLTSVTPDAYRSVTPGEARAVLVEWLEQYGPDKSKPIVGDMNDAFRLFEQSPFIYQLSLDDPHLVRVPWSAAGVFHEFVAVEPEGGVLVIVACDD
jgi:hypothetical protein